MTERYEEEAPVNATTDDEEDNTYKEKTRKGHAVAHAERRLFRRRRTPRPRRTTRLNTATKTPTSTKKAATTQTATAST